MIFSQFILAFYLYAILISVNSSVLPSKKQNDVEEKSIKTLGDNDYTGHTISSKILIHKNIFQSRHQHQDEELRNISTLLMQRQFGVNSINGSFICQRNESNERPLECYQCRSETGQRENDRCDADLWRFTRRSERFELKTRCPRGLGSYCVKKVQRKRGLQITERGCFGPGPVKATDGSLIKLQTGCVTFTQNGFLTVSCLCNSHDLCNSSTKDVIGFNKILSLFVICIILNFVKLQ